jgi:hypothetical protein
LPLVQNLRYHDYQFEYQVPPGSWKWTTRLDVSQSIPTYQVRDVISPYGLLRDSIPIPGPVVRAMADSITELQANFAPSILIGPPSSLIFSVDEGRGFSPSQTVGLTNSGVYGSILGVSLTTSAPFIVVNPSTVGNLSINESGEFTVEVDSTSLVAADSPYLGTVTIQDSTASNNPQTMGVTVNVRPKATIGASALLLVFNVTRPLSGPFPIIPTQSFNVLNTGATGSVLDFDIRALTGLCTNWLRSWLPAEGELSSGGSQTVTVTVQPSDNLFQGTYSEKLRISGYSSNQYLDVEIRLVVS